MSKMNYVKGERITDIKVFMKEINAGNLIYMNHRAYHPAFLISMQFRTVMNQFKVRKDGFGFFLVRYKLSDRIMRKARNLLKMNKNA